METVFNLNKIASKQSMFFGDKPNVSRYDILTHPIFEKLTQKQKGFFWQPEEIDLNKDNKDFKILSEAGKWIFTETLSYQTMLDSIQNRSPALALLPHCSLPELESCIEWWCAFEQIHASSYAHIIRNVYQNPSDVFDNIIENDEIVSRATASIKYYDDFLNYSLIARTNGKYDPRELKKKLLLCIASINALEGLSFYASFACSFAFAEQGLMVGNASIISLIARDEALHLAITQNILKKWSEGDDDPEMIELYQECLPEIKTIYENVIAQEKLWCKHLFKHGTIIGLNEKILSEYIEYMAGKRMKNLGLKTNYITKNPLTWMDKYLNSSDNQVAPMEQEIISYVIGGVKNDLSEANFSEFKF